MFPSSAVAGVLGFGKVLTQPIKRLCLIRPSHRKNVDQTITVTSTTKIFQGNRVGEFSDLAVGMRVKVIGLWRKSATR